MYLSLHMQHTGSPVTAEKRSEALAIPHILQLLDRTVDLLDCLKKRTATGVARTMELSQPPPETRLKNRRATAGLQSQKTQPSTRRSLQPAIMGPVVAQAHRPHDEDCLGW